MTQPITIVITPKHGVSYATHVDGSLHITMAEGAEAESVEHIKMHFDFFFNQIEAKKRAEIEEQNRLAIANETRQRVRETRDRIREGMTNPGGREEIDLTEENQDKK